MTPVDKRAGESVRRMNESGVALCMPMIQPNLPVVIGGL